VIHGDVANLDAIVTRIEPQVVTIASIVWHSKKLFESWYKLLTLAEVPFTVNSSSVPSIGLRVCNSSSSSS
jgi:hypothetical protein